MERKTAPLPSLKARRGWGGYLQLGLVRGHINEQILKHGFSGCSAAAAVGVPGVLQAVGSQRQHQLGDKAWDQFFVWV